MPYPNLPKKKWPKMERCVSEVKGKGKIDNAYAVCYNAVMKNHKKKKKRKSKHSKKS